MSSTCIAGSGISFCSFGRVCLTLSIINETPATILHTEENSKLWTFWTWKPWIHTQNGLHGRHVLHLHSGLRNLFLLLQPGLRNSLYNQPNAGGNSSYRREPPQNQKHHQYIIAVSQPMVSWVPRGWCENVWLLNESHSKLWTFWTWKPWIHTQNGLHGRHVLHLHSGLWDLFLFLWPDLCNSLYNQPNAGGNSSYRREPPQNQKHHQYTIAVSQPMVSWLPRGWCENVWLLNESHSKLWTFWTWKPWIHTQNGLHGRHVLHLHSGLWDLFLLLWPDLPNSLYNQPNAGGNSSYRREPPQNQKHHQYIIAVSQPMVSWLPRGWCENVSLRNESHSKLWTFWTWKPWIQTQNGLYGRHVLHLHSGLRDLFLLLWPDLPNSLYNQPNAGGNSSYRREPPQNQKHHQYILAVSQPMVSWLPHGWCDNVSLLNESHSKLWTFWTWKTVNSNPKRAVRTACPPLA